MFDRYCQIIIRVNYEKNKLSGDDNYCSKKGICQFTYPKPIVLRLHVKIIEKQ